MGKYTSLTKKTYRIFTKEEARDEFPDLQSEINHTPFGHVYLVIYDERPAPIKVPPQLIGPMPRSEATKIIRQQEDNYRTGLLNAFDNIVDMEKALQLGDAENEDF
ncbi:hypothetical protein [Shimazuella kribbensis]|uniref:hypothetical protein n=1 Tax=Shimazuella kribbensis TaxID=139808 RepID=UPI0004255FBB|nr:hypothetical protein [Shimazuella kribbensis]